LEYRFKCCTSVDSLNAICLSYIKRFLIIRDVYNYNVKKNNILGFENETHGRLYLKRENNFSCNEFIKRIKRAHFREIIEYFY